MCYTQFSPHECHNRTEEYIKAVVAKRQNAKITCECGAVVSKCNLPTHVKSAKHKQTIEMGVWLGPRGRGPNAGKRRPEFIYKTATEKANRIRERQISIRTCECGTKVLYNSFWNHKKSKKHLTLMQAKQSKKKKKYKLKIVSSFEEKD